MVRSVAGNLPEQVKNNQSVNTAAGNGGQKMSQYSWFTVYSACEGVFGRIKNEMFYNTDWSGVSISDFIGILNTYLQWYNETRIKKSLGYLSPMEYRRNLGLVA